MHSHALVLLWFHTHKTFLVGACAGLCVGSYACMFIVVRDLLPSTSVLRSQVYIYTMCAPRTSSLIPRASKEKTSSLFECHTC